MDLEGNLIFEGQEPRFCQADTLVDGRVDDTDLEEIEEVIEALDYLELNFDTRLNESDLARLHEALETVQNKIDIDEGDQAEIETAIKRMFDINKDVLIDDKDVHLLHLDSNLRFEAIESGENTPTGLE